MAESKKPEVKVKVEEKVVAKKIPQFRLVLQVRVAKFKADGWKETGKASRSGELIEMTK